MNIWDILITLLILSALILSVIFLIRNKKKGKSGCHNSSCSGCPYGSSCTKKERK